MAVVGSDITIDVHLSADAEDDAVRSVLRNQSQVHPQLRQRLEDAFEAQANVIIEQRDLGDVALNASLSEITGDVPGAPRERISGSLDFEADQQAVAAVADAVDTPERAALADQAEEIVVDFLAEKDLVHDVNVTVIVTPVEFH
jgi:hypothetical protein